MSRVFIRKRRYISKIYLNALHCDLDINHLRRRIDVPENRNYKLKFDLILNRTAF